VGGAAVVAFLAELALLALAAVAGWRLGGAPWSSILLAALLPGVVIAVWSRWFAPTSAHRVQLGGRRLAGQAAVFATGAGVAAAAGLTWWGVGLTVVAITAFALAG